MRHKWLAMLVLGIMMVVSLPTQTLAAEKEKTFHATMTNLYLGVGTVTPIPKDATGLGVKAWTVKDRPFIADLSGDINGSIAISYSGIMQPDQSGVLTGPFTIDTGIRDGKDLITGSNVLVLKGGTPAPIPNIFAFISDKPSLAYLPYLMYGPNPVVSFATQPVSTAGHMVMKNGTDSYAGFHAEAQFSGTVTVVLGYYGDGTNHVVGMLPGQSLLMTGKTAGKED